MRVDLALLADYALADKADKLTVAGVFRSVSATGLPFRFTRMFLALSMTVEAGEPSGHEMKVRLIDPDGGTLMELDGEVSLTRADPEADSTINLILEMNGVEFKRIGTHCFDIFLDGRFTERVPLEVALARLTEPGTA